MDVKDEILVQKVKQSILSIDKGAELILFGSRARGDARPRPDSDWDFLFLTSLAVTSALRKTLVEKLLDVELEENAIFQVIPKNKTDWETKYPGTPLYFNIKDEGIGI